MKSVLNIDQYNDLQSVIVDSLSSTISSNPGYPFLIQKDGKMSQNLFNYLMGSILSEDKTIEIPKNYNPKINLQTLAEKVK